MNKSNVKTRSGTGLATTEVISAPLVNDNLLQPTTISLLEQTRQRLRAALTEIEELRSTLRYNELEFAKKCEAFEGQKLTIIKKQTELDNADENASILKKEISDLKGQNMMLSSKIKGFHDKQDTIAGKNKSKAKVYMSQINDQEVELQNIRQRLVNQEEEMKALSNANKKFRNERDDILKQLTLMEAENKACKTKLKDQTRLLTSVCGHSKNTNQTLNELSNELSGDSGIMTSEQRGNEELQRVERIARQVNRSAFMPLGENPPKLYSESEAAILKPVSSRLGMVKEFNHKNESYLTDDSVPSAIYELIDKYREKARNSKPGDNLAMLIDDFFGESHAISKDFNLREIARIRNENAVEVTSLRRALDGMNKFSKTAAQIAMDKARENKPKASFADNDVERQRRLLIEENTMIKKKLRAQELILQEGNLDKKHFLDGAAWVAKKTQLESDRFTSQMMILLNEFDRRTMESLLEGSVDNAVGSRIEGNKEWMKTKLIDSISSLGRNFLTNLEKIAELTAEAQEAKVEN